MTTYEAINLLVHVGGSLIALISLIISIVVVLNEKK